MKKLAIIGYASAYYYGKEALKIAAIAAGMLAMTMVPASIAIVLNEAST